jgi:hypothetical protein
VLAQQGENALPVGIARRRPRALARRRPWRLARRSAWPLARRSGWPRFPRARAGVRHEAGPLRSRPGGQRPRCRRPRSP